MAIVRPSSVVTIGGIVQTSVLEWSSTLSVEAGIAQASIVVPAPAPAGVVEDAVVSITARVDDAHALTPVFTGKLRGPIDRGLTESDATVTLRCDGNLWRLALPTTFDMSWKGPITPKKVIKQMLLLRGIPPGTAHCQNFVHPTTGVPIILGGVPWFDEGRVICARGTSPFAFIDRIARLFGYRIFDLPNGRILVARVCGPPPESTHTFTEGIDVLNVRRATDLHPLQNFWEATGASGTDIVGQSVAVSSRPRRGQRSPFIPNPPKWAIGTVSDPLLVSAQLADTARIVAEIDKGGVPWNVSAEVIGLGGELVQMQPREGFTLTAPTIGLEGKQFWQTSVSHTWGSNGLWTSIEGWRPTGQPRKTKPVTSGGGGGGGGRGDSGGPQDAEPDYNAPITDAQLDPVPEPLAPIPGGSWGGWGSAGSWGGDGSTFNPGIGGNPGVWGSPGSVDDVGSDDDDVSGEPGEDALEADLSICPPPASVPARECTVMTLLEASWEVDFGDADVIEPFDVTQAADWISVSGEVMGGGGTVEVWQDSVMVGSAPFTGGPDDEWTMWSVVVAGTLEVGIEAEVRIVP